MKLLTLWALMVTVAISAVSEKAWAEGFTNMSGWTISSSATDPLVLNQPASNDTTELYLWLWCATDDSGGISRAKFSIEGGGDFSDFVPSPGVVEALGSFPLTRRLDLTLPGCPTDSFLAGSFLLTPGSSTYNICFSGMPPDFGVYVCNSPTVARDYAYVGYTAGPGARCSLRPDFFSGGIGGCEPVLAVEASSWGRIKALYLAD